MTIPICIAIGHVADFILDCFELLQVTETQIEIQHSQNCTVQKSVIYDLPFLVSTQAVFMSL